MTAAIDQAIGDIIYEFYDTTNLLDIFSEMSEITNDFNGDFTYFNANKLISDKIISLLAGYFLGVKIKSFINWPRVSRRESLTVWNKFNAKSKLLKINTYLFNRNIEYYKGKSKINYDNKNFVRTSLRTLIYGSSSPFRLVTIVAGLGALLSFGISVIVLIISLTKDVVTGWTTTNLLISSSTLLILITLGVLSEYINQIVNSTKSQNGPEIIFEISSNEKDFEDRSNIEKI